MHDDYWKRDAEMVRQLGHAIRNAGGGRGVMEWSAGSFSAKVAIEVNPYGETVRFDGPVELEAALDS